MTNLPDFDSDLNESDDDYFVFVAALEELSVQELVQAGDDTEQQKQAIKRYFERGMKANLTVGELWEFLGVSANSVMERAGLNATEEKLAASIIIAQQASAEAIEESDST